MSSSMRGLDSIVQAANLVEETGQNVLTLDTDDVVSRPQSREKFKRIEELAESIKASGQQQPIVVSPKNSKGKYTIQKGERRWRACKLLGVKVLAIVNNRHEKPLKALSGELAENIQRENLEPMELAKALSRFVDEGGMSQREISEELGKPLTYVSVHLSLLKLQDGLRERLYNTGLVTDPETLNNLRQLHQLDPEWVEEICAQVEAEEGLSRRDTREWLRVAKKVKDQGLRPKDAFLARGAPQESPAPSKERPGKGVGKGTLLEEQESDGNAQGSSEGASEPQPSSEGPSHQPGPSAKQEAPAQTGASESRGGSSEPTSKSEAGGQGAELPPPATATKSEAREQGWKDLPPEAIRVYCACEIDAESGELQMGWILTSRVDEEDGFVWVMLNNEGNEEPVRLPAEAITITSVREVG
ncbi:ParB/RepB/Spo0J family partition protein [Halomonas sp. DP5N14-9]|uniref:ParB/RepB/Spo0J family partition protein n=1 Tax=Halomonas sp. DP5N14-9 TaxID=2859075 RepID=UPI001C997C9C|nr:ParB/RepB/Spo0J family partition protein [Halomonas sp. DP5N14-9]MBY5940555.1 ParB/RepB/Spo0J family partition protein [Halomonas sp. DP5N14-9]